jgi:peptide/nickel transport system permease protein
VTIARPEADFNRAAVAEAADEAMALTPRSTLREAWERIRRNKMALAALVVVGIYVFIALVGFTGALNRVIEDTAGASYAPPAWRNAQGRIDPSVWLGTDFLGRSVSWRLLYGARVAMIVATLASLISVLIGATLGLTAGYFGKWVDDLIVWLFSTVSSIPGILLLISLAFVLKGYELPIVTNARGEPLTLTGIPAIVIALSLTSWVGLCRLIRGETIKLRERDYVTAGRAVGLRNVRILRRHILPNVFHLIIIDFSLNMSAFVQAEVILSFLGLGVTDQPSWGRMIDDAKLELLKGVWWQMVAATVAIFIFSLAINTLGDALRDALDPRLRGVD